MPTKTDTHIVKRFDQQLAHLRSLVLEMGGLVESQVDLAIQALDEEDLDTARLVIAGDAKVNALELKADEECTNLVALRQPVGSDLRMIMALARAVTDLERIGDEAEKIARMVVHLYDSDTNSPNGKLLRDVLTMSRLAGSMLHESLDGLARQDADKAVTVARGDVLLDQEYQAALRRLITYMMEDPRTIGHSIDVLFILKALERIGDHAKNIAEHTVYLVKGKDVRHKKMDDLPKGALEQG